MVWTKIRARRRAPRVPRQADQRNQKGGRPGQPSAVTTVNRRSQTMERHLIAHCTSRSPPHDDVPPSVDNLILRLAGGGPECSSHWMQDDVAPRRVSTKSAVVVDPSDDHSSWSCEPPSRDSRPSCNENPGVSSHTMRATQLQGEPAEHQPLVPPGLRDPDALHSDPLIPRATCSTFLSRRKRTPYPSLGHVPRSRAQHADHGAVPPLSWSSGRQWRNTEPVAPRVGARGRAGRPARRAVPAQTPRRLGSLLAKGPRW